MKKKVYLGVYISPKKVWTIANVLKFPPDTALHLQEVAVGEDCNDSWERYEIDSYAFTEQLEKNGFPMELFECDGPEFGNYFLGVPMSCQENSETFGEFKDKICLALQSTNVLADRCDLDYFMRGI